jgi:DNA-binding NarL/FixJ family response regulator
MPVVIAEALARLRSGIASLLKDEGHEVLAEVGDGEALLAVAEHHPDLRSSTCACRPTQTDEAVRAALELRRRAPDTAVPILSQYVEERYATKLLSSVSRGVGYLLKDRIAGVRELRAAARRVAAGGTAIDPEVVSQLLTRRRRADVLGDLNAARARGARADGRGLHELVIAERLGHVTIAVSR